MWRRAHLLLLALALLASSARAHDPFLAEIEARSEPGELVLRIVMARSVAAHLAGLTPNPRAFFAPADVPAHQSDFTRVGLGLCAVSTDGSPVAPLRSEIISGAEESEIVFSVAYRLAAGAKTRIEGSWLKRLPEGYAAFLHLKDRPQASRRKQVLTSEDPAGEIDLPSTAEPQDSR